LREGYGFVSFGDNLEGAKALKEMNGRYVGNRPCKLSKSTWDVRASAAAQTPAPARSCCPESRSCMSVSHRKCIASIHSIPVRSGVRYNSRHD